MPRNRRSLDEMNLNPLLLKGESKTLAEQCAELDWSDVDRADALTVARSVWHAQKPGIPFPISSFHANPPRKDD